ncbi:MAG: UDP-N-acetylglucosamine 2-epimerase [Muribaculaceae bacterium]|nr:UDP-N-acetylglucosamine 2-epimerase [Muribaculaceae bacterium]
MTTHSHNPRKVCIVTGTRAEWGLLSGIAAGLRSRDDVELYIVATNMHLMPRYGHTVDEITAAGFTVNACVEMDTPTDSAADTVRGMARCMAGMADAFERLKPDIVVILGDRTEMLAVASAAAVMRIPIAHIAGGEKTEGAIDDSIRHAITKLASLHLVSTDEYRHRVIQLGENPDLVINTGAIGVYNAMQLPPMSREELSASLGMGVDSRTLVVTYHPATLDDADVASRCHELLAALDRFPDSKVIITYPNNDARGRVIIDLIEEYARTNPGRVLTIPSLGYRRYLSALRLAGAAVGNSSSGIIEVPSTHIPTVDIGIRQKGRLAADSVIHCSDSADEIAAAIAKALSPEWRKLAQTCSNPYYKPDTLRLSVEAIALTPLEQLRSKSFHDL